MNTTTPFSIPTAAQVAATLERGARIAAPVICWAIAAFMTAAQIAYQLGHGLGSAVHARNDQLAAVARRLATGGRPTQQTAVVRPTDTLQPACEPQEQPQAPCRVVTTPAPLVHPLAALRDELSALTVAELRRLTGTRRKARKAELLTLALATA